MFKSSHTQAIRRIRRGGGIKYRRWCVATDTHADEAEGQTACVCVKNCSYHHTHTHANLDKSRSCSVCKCNPPRPQAAQTVTTQRAENGWREEHLGRSNQSTHKLPLKRRGSTSCRSWAGATCPALLTLRHPWPAHVNPSRKKAILMGPCHPKSAGPIHRQAGWAVDGHWIMESRFVSLFVTFAFLEFSGER